ncbi:MAG TPA: site-specific integrase [Verrucomicrobiae bacterium]|nr:site-specific integrase [Verrucomicrobiae bacterium]
MLFERKRYQFGYVRQKPRKTGPHVWVWEYRDRSGSHSVILGTIDQMSETDAWKATEGRRLILNDPHVADQVSFGAVLDRYMLEALPERKSTRCTYLSWIRSRIRPKWGDCPIVHVKPLAVELWLKTLPLSGRSRGHVREVMHMLFDWAMRWELIPHDRNPMTLVRVKGCSKRTRVPKILTIEEFNRLLEKLKEPYRTMALVALFLGPRVSEIAALKWSDIDWDKATISIARSWVVGEVGDTKTEGSAKPLPMDSDLAIVLKEHRERSKNYQSQWIFPNPATGNPFWPSKIRENHLVPAAIAAGIGPVGWHTFRHTYSSLLREHEVDIKVQQALLRHADIRTTMNIYTQAVPRAVREANRKVVRNILGKQGGIEAAIRVPETAKSFQISPSPSA